MADTLLPPRIDGRSRGGQIALWLFGLLIVVKAAMGLGSILRGYSVATTMDGIPLDTFTPAAARTAISLLALLGLEHVVLALVGVVALVRHRALVPLLFALLLIEQIGRKLVLWWTPIPRTGPSPGFGVNLALLAVTIAGLVLSLRTRAASGSVTRRP